MGLNICSVTKSSVCDVEVFCLSIYEICWNASAAKPLSKFWSRWNKALGTDSRIAAPTWTAEFAPTATLATTLTARSIKSLNKLSPVALEALTTNTTSRVLYVQLRVDSATGVGVAVAGNDDEGASSVDGIAVIATEDTSG